MGNRELIGVALSYLIANLSEAEDALDIEFDREQLKLMELFYYREGR